MIVRKKIQSIRIVTFLIYKVHVYIYQLIKMYAETTLCFSEPPRSKSGKTVIAIRKKKPTASVKFFSQHYTTWYT